MMERLYYINAPEGPAGPWPAVEILAMEARGEIDGSTLLWSEGFAEWLSLDDLRAEMTPPPPVQQSPSPLPPAPKPTAATPVITPTPETGTSKTLKKPSRRWIWIALAVVILLLLLLWRSCPDEQIAARQDDPDAVGIETTIEAPPPEEDTRPVAVEVGRITFLGAAAQVSGSCHLVEFEDVRFIIDAGAMLEDPRSGRALRPGQSDRFFEDMTADPKTLEFLILTHAHADHMGRLPWLFAMGARPKIVLTPATRDLLRKSIGDMLKTEDLPNDDLFLVKGSRVIHSRRECPHVRNVSPAEIESWRTGRRKAYEERRDLCSWCIDAAWRTMEALMIPLEFGQEKSLTERLRVTLHAASHMLGAAWARIEYDATPETTIVLVASGDMGDDRNLVFPRTLVEMESDFALIESTYGYAGEEAVPDEGKWESLRPFLQDIGAALAAKKMVLIPAFVTDRSHKVIAALQYGMRERIIPSSIPIHLTSSTAADLVDVYAAYARPGSTYHTETFQALFHNTGLSPYRPANLRLGQQREYPRPSIVIAHSAMMDQGESKRLLEEFVDDPGVHIVIVGYQAPQSPGGRIKNMSETTIILAGREREIKASRVSFSHLFSSHARGSELTKWLLGVQPRESIFIVHGSPSSGDALRRHLETHPSLRGRTILPKYLERYPLLTTRLTQSVVYQEPRVVGVASGAPSGPAAGVPAGSQSGATAPGGSTPASSSTATTTSARTPRPEVGRPAVTSIRDDAVTISRTLTINGVVRDISNNVRWPAMIEFRDAALKTALSSQVATAHALSTTAAPLIVTKIEATPVNRGSVIAEATVELNNGLRLKGVRLLKTREGERALPPSEKKDGQWINHARFGNELEEQIRRAIREKLGQSQR